MPEHAGAAGASRRASPAPVRAPASPQAPSAPLLATAARGWGPAEVLALQRATGNRAVQRLLAGRSPPRTPRLPVVQRATGLARPADTAAFVAGYRQLAEHTAEKLLDLVNVALGAVEVPPILRVILDPAVTGALFDSQAWTISVDAQVVADAASGKAAARAELVESLYHEARHAEQAWRVANATDAASPEALAKRLSLHASVADLAYRENNRGGDAEAIAERDAWRPDFDDGSRVADVNQEVMGAMRGIRGNLRELARLATRLREAAAPSARASAAAASPAAVSTGSSAATSTASSSAAPASGSAASASAPAAAVAAEASPFSSAFGGFGGLGEDDGFEMFFGRRRSPREEAADAMVRGYEEFLADFTRAGRAFAAYRQLAVELDAWQVGRAAAREFLGQAPDLPTADDVRAAAGRLPSVAELEGAIGGRDPGDALDGMLAEVDRLVEVSDRYVQVLDYQPVSLAEKERRLAGPAAGGLGMLGVGIAPLAADPGSSSAAASASAPAVASASASASASGSGIDASFPAMASASLDSFFAASAASIGDGGSGAAAAAAPAAAFASASASAPSAPVPVPAVLADLMAPVELADDAEPAVPALPVPAPAAAASAPAASGFHDITF